MSVLLIGQPNVGKSVIMNALTGARAVISNYPGTTVEITAGAMTHEGKQLTVVDTPGTYTLHSDTDEQRVTQRLLIGDSTHTIVNVVDATNLARNLYLTMQLLDFEMPMVIALNQMDRAHDLGLDIDTTSLERALGVPVIPLSAVRGVGIAALKDAITSRAAVGRKMAFSEPVESSIQEVARAIRRTLIHSEPSRTGHPERALAIHLLEHDTVDEELLAAWPGLRAVVEECHLRMDQGAPCRHDCYRDCRYCEARTSAHPLFPTCTERTDEARRLAATVVRRNHRTTSHPIERVEAFIDRPATGMPVLIVTAVLAFKAVTLAVESFESLVSSLAPWVTRLTAGVVRLLPFGNTRTLIDAITGGILLPVQVVLPAMLSVNILIALLEDSGLMSRFSVMADRLASLIGLPGQAVIPISLGFGCRAPAILATRTLGNRRQRFIGVTLLSIPVPCAASLGLIAGLLAKFEASVTVVVATMVTVFVVLGVLLERFLPGKSEEFVIEVPPLRAPSVRNVILKTWMRSRGFLGHVLPLLLGASIVVRLLIDSGALAGLAALSPWTLLLFGIPGEVFVGIVVTALQRYIAPLVLLSLPLSAREATIACAMVSLSYPCLPVSMLVLREMGWRTLAAVLAIATCVPLVTGIILNIALP